MSTHAHGDSNPMKKLLFLVMQINIMFAFYLTNKAKDRWFWGEISGKMYSPCAYREGEYVAFIEFYDIFCGDDEKGDPALVKIVKVEHERQKVCAPDEIKTYPSVRGLWERKCHDFESTRESMLEALQALEKLGFKYDILENDVLKPKLDSEPILVPHTTMI